VLAPAHDHFPNNIGSFFKFRAGVVAKYVFFFCSRERYTRGAAYQDSRVIIKMLVRSSRGCGFGLRREQNFRTMCGSHSHPLQPHVVLCFCNFKCCSLIHCRTVHFHVLCQISSRSPHRHLVQSSNIFRSFLVRLQLIRVGAGGVVKNRL
jgi:hypothetical protein